MQLYRYFVSHSSEFCCHNPLCCISVSVYFVIDSVRKLLDTSSYMWYFNAISSVLTNSMSRVLLSGNSPPFMEPEAYFHPNSPPLALILEADGSNPRPHFL